MLYEQQRYKKETEECTFEPNKQKNLSKLGASKQLNISLVKLNNETTLGKVSLQNTMELTQEEIPQKTRGRNNKDNSSI